MTDCPPSCCSCVSVRSILATIVDAAAWDMIMSSNSTGIRFGQSSGRDSLSLHVPLSAASPPECCRILSATAGTKHAFPEQIHEPPPGRVAREQRLIDRHGHMARRSLSLDRAPEPVGGRPLARHPQGLRQPAGNVPQTVGRPEAHPRPPAPAVSPAPRGRRGPSVRLGREADTPAGPGETGWRSSCRGPDAGSAWSSGWSCARGGVE